MEQEFRRCVHEARQCGQTVFRSSHILSEVEAVFAATPPDLRGVPGVSHVAVHGQRVSLQVQGSSGPLIDALAGSGVQELVNREPSLEELFLAHYGASSEEKA